MVSTMGHAAEIAQRADLVAVNHGSQETPF
jgi:hypothetical protein